MSFDCAAGQMCNVLGQCVAEGDAGPPIDTGARPDTGPTDRDAALPDGGRRDGALTDGGSTDAGQNDGGFDSGFDAGSLPDTGPPVGTGRYLDRCTTGGSCLSGVCVDDVGGTRMCTIACTAHTQCVGEHVCGPTGSCVRDDTGVLCSLASPELCALGLCFGNVLSGIGECTRDCGDARDCPSGYACVDAVPGTRVCTQIEKPCSTTADCSTGICIPGLGCTSECSTALDCPQRFYFLAPYRCEIALGSTVPICNPPADIIGPDAIGTPCSLFGDATCRSGPLTCDSTPLGPFCTQSCTEEGNCADGLGCFPSLEDVGAGLEILPLCSRAGTRPIGAPCANGRNCDSGLCDSVDLVCTRLCTDDAICPSAMACRAIAGFGRSVCRLL